MKSTVTILLSLLLLSTSFPTINSFFSYNQLQTLTSLAHSLMNRVASLRATRGDFTGSERARRIAEKLEGGLGLWRGIWSMSWDYIRNYSWRDMETKEMFGAVSDMTQFLSALGELTQLESDKERATWFIGNYQRVFNISRSILQRLLKVFIKSGSLRELVLTLQREVEGGLIMDCLTLGSNDLKGLMQIIKDVASQFSSSNRSENGRWEEL
ncbi:hypothetical protein GIB67_025159 [Kingdonia uniflora]|uniref:Uncharacterized protein n=1 Tax=Kingdonia uniflora TaxID=39325 RepID=A0A7J7N819_9MAGN|nr:hypothetical protein GIB67_025159 [Kingdonia uniflora]